MSLLTTPRQLAQRGQFYQQLAQLTAAGLPIIQSLEMLSRNPPARSFREPIERMLKELAEGATVSESMPHLGSWVPAFDIALVEAAERSGRLDFVFKLLAGYYEERSLLLRRAISDLAYPVFLFHFAILLFPFINWFKGSISGMTFFLETGGILGSVYFAVGLLICLMKGERSLGWRAALEKILRFVPLLGSARHALALARLAAALEALINAGMNIIEGWEMAAVASGSPGIQKTVLAWKPELAAGKTPSETVNAAPTEFPEIFANLYHSGEISGQLDDALRRLHNYYQEEAFHKFKIISQWGPRLVYFGVAGMIAYKIISFYSNYFGEINKLTQ